MLEALFFIFSFHVFCVALALPSIFKMTADQDATIKVNETTPLLSSEAAQEISLKYGKSVLYRALLCGFMVSLSFGVTQVP